MKKIVTLLLSFILPGIGHISQGRIAVGVAFFLGVVAIANSYAWLVLPYYGASSEFNTPDPTAAWKTALAVACFCVVWIGCQAHLLYLLYLRDPERRKDEMELAFREGLRYYLVDELPAAIGEFERVLRIDPFDCDACFHLAVCLSRAGKYRRARRRFKKCTELDDARKWAQEIGDELERMKGARTLRTIAQKAKAAS